MTVYAITDTKKGRTGIAPTYLQTTPTVHRKHTTVHNGAIVCRHSCCAVVCWLNAVIYCPSRGSDSVRNTG